MTIWSSFQVYTLPTPGQTRGGLSSGLESVSAGELGWGLPAVASPLDQSSALAQSGFQLAEAQETPAWCGPDRSPSLLVLDSQTIRTPSTAFYQGIEQYFQGNLGQARPHLFRKVF